MLYRADSQKMEIVYVRLKKADCSTVETPLNSAQEVAPQVTQSAPAYNGHAREAGSGERADGGRCSGIQDEDDGLQPGTKRWREIYLGFLNPEPDWAGGRSPGPSLREAWESAEAIRTWQVSIDAPGYYSEAVKHLRAVSSSNMASSITARSVSLKVAFSIAFLFGIALLGRIEKHGPGSQIEKRIQFAKALQTALFHEGSPSSVVDEERPLPTLRIQNPRLTERESDIVARSMILKTAPQMMALGYKQLQLTDGAKIWTYSIQPSAPPRWRL